MTPAHSSPEQDLSRTLQAEADRFAQRGGTNVELDQVLSRAGEIRRGRRMRATMMMAAVVLAVAIPVGISAIGSDPSKPKTPPVATKPDDSVIGLGELKTGKAPKNGYVDGDTLVIPGSASSADGTEVTLGDIGQPNQVARITGGFLVSTFDPDNGEATTRFVGDDGDDSGKTWPIEGGFAVSDEGNVGAFVEPDGTVVAVQDNGSVYNELGRLPSGGSYSVAAVTGPNCSGRSEENGCTVYATDNGENPMVWAISPNTAPEPAFPRFKQLNDVSVHGAAAGLVSVSDEGSCSEVRDVDDVLLWKTCDYSLMTFSPDGKYLLAGPAYRDGAGDGQLSVLDTQTGKVVLDLDTTRDAFINGQRWEDDTHVLTSVSENGRSALVRFEVNGSREYAVAPAADSEDFISPFLLG